ncbi:MAG: hypothetical protein M3H12_02790 [Chromatiales bacterium]|nr:hypothetical protein [Gammaproteobacteria bacterium]
MPSCFAEKYAEARKTLMDLLNLRSSMTTVSIGDTIREIDLDNVKKKAEHAENIGVDFIQMRPELLESARTSKIGFSVCDKVKELILEYSESRNFAVIHTDGERSFQDHDEPCCYAMHLVPTLVPDRDDGWTRVMPCSYAINHFGVVPNLGRMKEGAKFSEFWERMNKKLKGTRVSEDSRYEVTINSIINPSKDCPQCRYFRLNKRIEAIKSKDAVHLIDAFVKSLNDDSGMTLDMSLCSQIEELFGDTNPQWGKVIDIDMAKEVFSKSRKLGIVPSF